MNASNSPAPRRRRWPWVLAAVLLTPVILLAAAAASYLTLNRDASALRREVMAATETKWNTKIQFSAGRLTFGAVRTCLAFGTGEKIREARAALAAVNSVSVGVYQRDDAKAGWSREKLFNATDRTMRDRGWSRLVGVVDHSNHVLIYVPEDSADIGRISVAVVNGRELVVVSAALDPEALAELVAHHGGKNLKHALVPLGI